MKSDLSNVEVGDWIWTIKSGWVKVEGIGSNTYAITTKECAYTMDGLRNLYDTYPSAFTEPPSGFNAEPKPCEFEKGQRVLVRDHANMPWRRRYFVGENPNRYHKEKFGTFAVGADEWSSEGRVRYWKFCKPWVEGEDECK